MNSVYMISNSYETVKISNFSRRGQRSFRYNTQTVMTVSAQSRVVLHNGSILVNRGLALVLVRSLTLLLLVGVAGKHGGAGT